MKIWHNLSAPAKSWVFVRPLESKSDSNGTVVAANTAFTALWPVVQPLSATLQMVAERRKPYYILDVVFTRHMREAEVPAHVAVTALVKESDPSLHSEEVSFQLTPQALADWVARAYTQQLPEGYYPLLDSLHLYFTRARLLEYQEPSAELVWSQQTYAIPVEKREDGLWVSGPLPYTTINPPITVTLQKIEKRVALKVCVGWSPWVEAGAAEAELLKTCLHELEKHGWQAR